MDFSQEENVADLIDRVQKHVLPRRIRCKEFFHDFDTLRSGRCTNINFARALGMLGVNFTTGEVDLLVFHFTDFSPHVIEPQVVNYGEFCRRVDEVFADEDLQDNVKSAVICTSPAKSALNTRSVAQTLEEEEHFCHVMHRVTALCKARGVSIKNIYTELDRLPVPNPSRLNPYYGGKCTLAQFTRKWPFKKELSPADFKALCQRYATAGGDIHFIALHNDVSDVGHAPPPGFPTSPLHLRPDHTKWSHASLPSVDKVRAKAIEKRCRLKEHFQDWDPLRKGVCSPLRVKTVFTVCDLARDLDRAEMESILRRYTKDDGLFNYSEFCDDVYREFGEKGLETQPLAKIEMPDASTTAPARRNPMRLTQDRRQQIRRIEDKIRTFVRKQRVELRNKFGDFDQVHRGFVTKNQFRRVMSSVHFDVDAASLNLLAGEYCDFGNHTDFNYMKFLQAVDPLTPDVKVALTELSAPYRVFKLPYFDIHGQVIPRSCSTPMLKACP